MLPGAQGQPRSITQGTGGKKIYEGLCIITSVHYNNLAVYNDFNMFSKAEDIKEFMAGDYANSILRWWY